MTDRCGCGSKVGDYHLPACEFTGIVTGLEMFGMGMAAHPGLGKSEAMAELAKKFGYEVKDIFDTVKPDPVVTLPSNSRYNVCAMDGTPIPDHVVEGGNPTRALLDLVIDLAAITEADKQPVTTLERFMQRARVIVQQLQAEDEAEKDQPVDTVGYLVPDEDGDLHSPAWYLDAFLSTREAYKEAHEKASTSENLTPEQELAQIHQLDDLLLEHEVYGTMVNKLFGSKAVEGQWNSSKVEADK